MRTLLLLRGCMGSGKSTWIKKNKLEQYTLSADEIRLLFQSPVLDLNGNLGISQKNDGKVWELLFKLLEDRMDRGEFTIIDATHSRTDMISRYKKLAEKYRYRICVMEFKEELEELLKRNSEREEYKKVPEEAIKNAYTRIETQKTPGYCEVIDNEKFKSMNDLKRDLSNFNKIVVFGDIHGCFEPLKEYFDKNEFDSNTFYIFLGDYIDRGIQNYEVITFLNKLSENKNVLLLEGNHEKHLRNYSFNLKENLDEVIKSKEFLNVTLPEIEGKGYTQKDARELYRKIGQLAYFTFGDKTFLINHGGITNIPNLFTSTDELIYGVGKYEDSLDVDKSWIKKTEENFIQIHGHRNITNEPVKTTERTFNLCDSIEFGGNLRVLEITKDKGLKEILIKNNLFNSSLKSKFNVDKLSGKSNEEIVRSLLVSNNLNKKQVKENVYSFNFSRNAFYDKKWNEVTTKARGLYINLDTNKIVARSYEKFFNINEREETKIHKLKDLNYPLVVYKKENGFLGILSYYKDDWFIATKSTIEGDYATMFRDILKKEGVLTDKLKEYIQKNNVSLVFEVIDIKNDPHIIKYDSNELILLDIINNTFEFKCIPYEELITFSEEFKFKCKQKEYTFNSFEEFKQFYDMISEDYESSRIEGYVICDKKYNMVKLKSNYYCTWKHMRAIKDSVSKGHNIKLSELTTPIMNSFYAYIKSKSREELFNKSLIQLREEYENASC